MIESTSQAVGVLKDHKLSEFEREQGIRYIQNHPSPEGAEALVAALEDSDFGVRWTAAAALADMGEAGMPALLRALSTPGHDDQLLREGARHVLHYNTSAKVSSRTGELLKALKGPGAETETMLAASRILREWD